MNRKIGAHVSCSGGYLNGLQKAQDIGANCFQIFSASPRMWARKALDTVSVTVFAKQVEQAQMNPVFTHAMYLLNLGSPQEESVKKSIEVLKYDLRFDALINGSGVVVHLGSHLGEGWQKVREQVAASIRDILRDVPDNATFLIENSAGQNGKLSSDLGEIRWLLDTVDSPKLGWCLDTCHAFAAGYRFGREELAPEKVGKLGEIGELTTIINHHDLWQSLKCIHVNDSKDLFGSGRDRHENLGQGSIPQSWFREFLSLQELKNIPLILEVPGTDKQGPDAENIQRLKSLTQKKE